MSDLKELTRQFIDGINQGNLDVIDELVNDDFVEHEELPPGMEGSGKDLGRQLFYFSIS